MWESVMDIQWNYTGFRLLSDMKYLLVYEASYLYDLDLWFMTDKGEGYKS